MRTRRPRLRRRPRWSRRPSGWSPRRPRPRARAATFERWREAEQQLLAEQARERRAAEQRQRSLREADQAAQEARRAAQQAQADWLAARWWRRPRRRAQQAASAVAAAAAVLLAVGAVGAGAWYVGPVVGQPVVEVARGLADLVPGPHREPQELEGNDG